jgi:hypothetical protein
MKKTITFLAIFWVTIAYSQVGIGTVNPNSNSILDLTATNKAFLLPRVANTATITTPTNGMMIYDISSKCVRSYESGAWSNCLSSPLGGVITDWAETPLTIGAITTAPTLSATPIKKKAFKRQVGSDIEFKGTYEGNGATNPGNGLYLINLPDAVDYSKYASVNNIIAADNVIGTFSITNAVNSTIIGLVQLYLNNTAIVYFSPTGSNFVGDFWNSANSYLTNTASFSFDIKYAALGKSSNLVMSSQVPEGDIIAEYQIRTGATVNANTPTNFETKIFDNSGGAVTTGSGWRFKNIWGSSLNFIVDVYSIQSLNTVGCNFTIYKNGVLLKGGQGALYSSNGSNIGSMSLTITLNPDDYIDFRPQSTSQFNSGLYTGFRVKLLGQNQTIATEPTVAAKKFNSTGQSIIQSTPTTVIWNSDTDPNGASAIEGFDTHGMIDIVTGEITYKVAGIYEISGLFRTQDISEQPYLIEIYLERFISGVWTPRHHGADMDRTTRRPSASFNFSNIKRNVGDKDRIRVMGQGNNSSINTTTSPRTWIAIKRIGSL